MSEAVRCVRCSREAPPIQGITYPGELGRELAEKVCADCWAEWQGAEVIIINELRLNFMDPKSQETLVQHLREFLCLGPTPASE